ncbi:hypothetical protein FJY93_02770 [Candidatus Kaiserbacteria bacterium]|nr:hypothetical protein [Candidatus Kaiserbacteria bacterium]
MYFRTSPIFSVLIITLLIVGGSGVPHLGMHMEMDGSMNADCFMPGMTAICQISPLEHIAAWKVTFAALPWQKDIASLLLLLLAFSVGLVCWINKIPIRPPSLQRVPARYARKEYLPPANPFQELFSNGILHSKVF